MNMPIDLKSSQVGAKVRVLALELVSQMGIEEDDLDILLNDPEIYETLQKKAQAEIEAEENSRKQEILMTAKKKLGIFTEKPKKVILVATSVSQPSESDWKKYMREGNHSLPNSLAQLETREEVSAARGFLIAVLNRHRRNADWIKDELEEAVGIWDNRAQKVLRVINEFFGEKKNVLKASSESYFKVSKLIEGDSDLRWYIDGPTNIQAELDAKKNEERLAQAVAAKRQQKKEALEGKKQEIVSLLCAVNIATDVAERLAGATIKKFPDMEIEGALLQMAINRQVSAIQQDREFLEKVAPEAQPYLLGSSATEREFLLKVCQHSEVVALQKRDLADSKVVRR